VGALHGVAFLDLDVRSKKHGADVLVIEVHDHAGHVSGEKEQFAKHRLVEAIAKRDAIADGDDRADVIGL